MRLPEEEEVKLLFDKNLFLHLFSFIRGTWYNNPMSHRKTIAINTISQITGKLITSVTTFIISVLIARNLGADGYGDFTKVTTFVAFFYLFSDFGLNPAYLELAAKPKAAKTLLSLRTILGFVLIILCLGILWFLPGTAAQGYTPAVKFGIILFSISILLQALITSANAFFQKHLRYDYATYALAGGSLLTLLLIIQFPLLHIPETLITILLAFLTGTLLTTLIALFFARKVAPEVGIGLDMPLARSMLTIALPLGLTLISNVIYVHADSVILTLTRTSAEVGIYGFAYKLFEFPLVIPTFFMNAVFPLLLLSKTSEDTLAMRRQIKQSAMILFPLSLALLLCGYVAAPFLSLIRSDFTASIAPFRVLLFGLPIFYLTSITMWTLIALKKRRVLLTIYTISMVLNIGANIFLTPTYGYMAAAWITVVSELFVLLASFLIIQKHFNTTISLK